MFRSTGRGSNEKCEDPRNHPGGLAVPAGDNAVVGRPAAWSSPPTTASDGERTPYTKRDHWMRAPRRPDKTRGCEAAGLVAVAWVVCRNCRKDARRGTAVSGVE